MATAKADLSIADLEKLVEQRETQVEDLYKKRDQLEQTIADLDAEIQDFVTTGTIGGRARRKRPKNESPLLPIVLEILGKNKKGLSLKSLAEQVKATGYKSHSRNFTNVVYQCVYKTKSIVHDNATGLYRIQR